MTPFTLQVILSSAVKSSFTNFDAKFSLELLAQTFLGERSIVDSYVR